MLRIESEAAVLGGLRYVELQLFAHLGAGAPSAATPALTVWASTASMSAAWRAGLLAGLLPVSTGLEGVDECTKSAGPATDDACARLTEVVDDGLARFVANDVYPALEWAYERRIGLAHPAAGGPTVLVLSRLRADLIAAQRLRVV